MSTSINSLPYEILSQILEQTILLNRQENPTYTYGLSQAPEPLCEVQIQRVLRGQVSPDALKWAAAYAIAQVNRKWHDWACRYAFRALYIRRWRGSER